MKELHIGKKTSVACPMFGSFQFVVFSITKSKYFKQCSKGNPGSLCRQSQTHGIVIGIDSFYIDSSINIKRTKTQDVVVRFLQNEKEANAEIDRPRRSKVQQLLVL